MTVKDIGPEPQSFNLEQETVENSNYRTVAWSGKYLQLTLMSIPQGGDVGLEMHPATDQFLRLDAGRLPGHRRERSARAERAGPLGGGPVARTPRA